MKIYTGDIVRLTPLAPIGKDLVGDDLTCSVLEVIEGSDENEIVVLDQYGEDWLLEDGEYTLYEKVNPKHEKLGYVLNVVKEYMNIELEDVELDSKDVSTLIGDAKVLVNQINQILNIVKNKKGMGGLIRELISIQEYTKDYIDNHEKYKGVNILDKQLDMEEACTKHNIKLYNLG